MLFVLFDVFIDNVHQRVPTVWQRLLSNYLANVQTLAPEQALKPGILIRGLKLHMHLLILFIIILCN